MYRAAGGDRPVDGAAVGRVAVEAAIGDGLVDQGDVLVHDAARPEAHVAHLGIAHLAGGQANVQAGAGDQGVWRLLPEPVPDRGPAQGNRIVAAVFPVAPAVQDDQNGGFPLASAHLFSRSCRPRPMSLQRGILACPTGERIAYLDAWLDPPGRSADGDPDTDCQRPVKGGALG
jgi:hypothetical protein